MLSFGYTFLKRQLKYTHLLTLVILLFSPFARTQINIVENTRIVLPAVDNYRTVIDKKGVVWICSENGLTRFNFENSKRFQVSDGLPTNDIWQLYCDKFDRIWLYHKEDGIFFTKNDTVQRIKGSEKLRQTFVVADLNDTIFFKQFGFFNPYEIGETYFYTKSGKFGKCNLNQERDVSLAGNRLTSKILNSGNRIYNDIKGNTYHDYVYGSYGNVATDDPPKIVYNVNADKTDISFLSKESNQIQNISRIVGGPIGRSIFFRNSKECILEINNSIRFYSNIALNERDFNIERILDPFYQLFGTDFNFSKDSNGNIWITVHRGGVHFIPESYISIFPLKQIGAATSQVKEENIVYLGCINDCLFAISRNSIIQELNLKTGRKKTIGSSKGLKDVKLNGDYIAWSNDEDVLIYNVKTGITKKAELRQRVVSFDFYDDSTIYTNTGHKYNFLRDEIKRQKLVQGPIDHLSIISSVLFNYLHNQIIVRNKNDLKIIYKSKQDNVINVERISNDQVGFFIENNGVIIFNNHGKKIGHFFTGVSIQAAFYYKDYFFAVSDQEILFAPINKGGNVSRKSQQYQTFLSRINMRIQSATIYKNTLILGLNNGIYNYDIHDVLDRSLQAPKLFFKGLSINNIPKGMGETKFLYSDRDISFAFNAYSYGNFGEVNLNYKLEGLDTKWSSSQSQTILFKSLPPGEYTLSVYASAVGKHSSVFRYSFSIPKPFWQSTLFIIFCIIILMVVMIKLFQIRINYRSRVYERKNMLLELEFKALKAQLNPHFIFNSLNSLQTVMHRKSEMEANEYIVSFSRLMRTLLDNSRVLSISLKDEIEFLKNFVFLSAQKINDPISFIVELNNITDPSKIQIRNMILQPFIENAVLHGLANKKGEKWIRLEFKQKEDALIVEITDNGVGREAAEQFNRRKADKHNSVSTTILKEKSRLLKEMSMEELNFKTIDLFEDDVPTGTKVIVQMKIFN